MVQPASVLDSFSPDGVGVGLITEKLALMGFPHCQTHWNPCKACYLVNAIPPLSWSKGAEPQR
jgi:hypothetical protein